MSNYVANCPISMQINTFGVRPEINMGGLMFSYDWGLMYDTTAAEEEPRLRSPQEY